MTPHETAERAVLGAILLDPETLRRVDGVLTPEDFASKAHRLIYRRILEIDEDGDAIDLVSLTARLDEAGDLARVGGVEYLAKLDSELVGVANATSHARLIREASLSRQDHATRNRVADQLEAEARRLRDGADLGEVSPRLIDIASERRDVDVPDWRSFSELAKDFGSRHIEAKELSATDVVMPTGHRRLDDALALTWGSFIVIGARAKTGKTTLALNIIRNAAEHHSIKSLLHSWEMPGVETFAKVVSEASVHSMPGAGEAGVSVRDMLMPGALTQRQHDLMATGYGRVMDLPVLLNTQHRRLGDILRISRRAIRHEGVRIVAVDYLQLADADRAPGESEERAVARVSVAFRNLALDETERGRPCVVIGISQLSRAPKGREHIAPTMSDLRHSGQIEQDATHILLLHDLDIPARDRDGNPKAVREDLAGHVAVFITQRIGGACVVLLEKQLEYSRFRSAHTADW